jgi:hypothetical protein
MMQWPCGTKTARLTTVLQVSEINDDTWKG